MILYIVLAAWGLQRLWELRLSARNRRWLQSQGAVLVDPDGFAAIVAVHALAFALPVVEHLVWSSVWGWWTPVGAVLFLAGQGLRHHAIRRLGPRWNTRVFVLPEAPLVKEGLYGRIRHPNYLGVALELAGLPIAFGLWRTALAVTLLNGLALTHRIRIEDQAIR